MTRYSLTSAHLFDRRWRAGHPFRPRTCRARKLGMGVLLALLWLIIIGYAHFTDAQRIRSLAEGYLSTLTGGRVTVGKATLSIFEGLRLDDVRVYVEAPPGDPTWGGAGHSADRSSPGCVFWAHSFVISYDPRSMLHGDLQAMRIVAEKPHVRLIQDANTGEWNYLLLGQWRQNRPLAPSRRAKQLQLPEVVLRDARVDIGESRNGKLTRLGFISIDGRLTPNLQSPPPAGESDALARPPGLIPLAAGAGEPHDPIPGRYDFVLQSRGASDAVGPLASGTVDLISGRVTASLGRFQFGHDIRSMLLNDSRIREWADRHELAGRVDIPRLDYAPGHDQTPPTLRVEMELHGVSVAAPAEEWVGASETARWAGARAGVEMARRVYQVAGFACAEPVAKADRRAAEAAAPETRPSPASASAATPADRLARLLDPEPVRLSDVSGSVVVTPAGIDVRHIAGQMEGNPFEVSGRIDGFGPQSGITLHVESDAAAGLRLPADPRYVWSLPRDLCDVYSHLHPVGVCRLCLDLRRAAGQTTVATTGCIDISRGRFTFDQFPYPLRDVSGRVTIEHVDPITGAPGPVGWSWVRIEDMHGNGVAGGRNADAVFNIEGWLGPIGHGTPDPGIDLTIRCDEVRDEPAVSRAFGPDLRSALAVFDAPGKGQFPRFRGSFRAHVTRPSGYDQRLNCQTDIHLADADAMLVGFAYPVHHVTADVHVGDGRVVVRDATMRRGDAVVQVGGNVSLGDPTPGLPLAPPTRLHVSVRNLPIDQDLIAALPPDCAAYIKQTGVQGLLDVNGDLFARPGADPTTRPTQTLEASTPGSERGPTASRGIPLDYDLAVALHDGTVRPRGGTLVISNVGGQLQLTPDRIELSALHGQRGKAQVSANGSIAWANGVPRIAFNASAHELSLDRDLYALLPAPARQAWDELRPKGALDADVRYASADPSKPAPLDLTAPSPGSAALPAGFRASLRLHDLSACPRTLPYPLDHVSGAIDVEPDGIRLHDMVARHGAACIRLDGAGTIEDRPSWKLKLSASDLQMDDALRQALPQALSGLCASLKLQGRLGLRLDQLSYRPGPAGQGGDEPEIDLRGALTMNRSGLDVGVPITDLSATFNFDAAVRQGRLRSLAGSIDADSLSIAGRRVSDLKATAIKPADRQMLQVDRIRGSVADGDLDGRVQLDFPDAGPSRYGLSLVVRDADVKELAGETDQNLSGRLTASLALEGEWANPNNRRGRGDVVVTGKEMYRIPVILGMLQVTNLALPISSPFQSGVARYSVEGQKVTFEKIELRSDHMLMSGSGKLDFATRQVRMNFVTDNPGGFKIPIIHDLWRSAQHELLRIQVRGAVQAPKVEARSMNTLWTTVDEVFKGDGDDNSR